MHIVYAGVILLAITALAAFCLSRYLFLKNKSYTSTKEDVHKSLYKYGVVVEGNIVSKSSRLITIFEIFDSLISRVNARQRTISYVFTAQDGNTYSGAGIVFFWLEPWIFLAINKIKIIYDPNDPVINLIYTDIKNKKYNLGG